MCPHAALPALATLARLVARQHLGHHIRRPPARGGRPSPMRRGLSPEIITMRDATLPRQRRACAASFGSSAKRHQGASGKPFRNAFHQRRQRRAPGLKAVGVHAPGRPAVRPSSAGCRSGSWRSTTLACLAPRRHACCRRRTARHRALRRATTSLARGIRCRLPGWRAASCCASSAPRATERRRNRPGQRPSSNPGR